MGREGVGVGVRVRVRPWQGGNVLGGENELIAAKTQHLSKVPCTTPECGLTSKAQRAKSK